MKTEIVNGSLKTEIESISDKNRIEEILKKYRQYKVSIVIYENGKSTRGRCIPIKEIIDNKETPGNKRQKGYRAYKVSQEEGDFYFFQLNDVLSIEVVEYFSFDNEKKKKTANSFMKKYLTIFFNL